MDTRHFIWIGVLVGGFIGGWIPTLWDASMFSMSSVIGNTIGGLVGLYIGYEISQW